MSEKAYFEQVEQKILTLMADKKYKEAYKICAEVLEKFPDERRFKKILEKITKEVKDINEEAADKIMKELHPLWKEEKYEEILLKLRQALRIAPKYPKLIDTFTKAQKLYEKKSKKLKKKFSSEQNKRLKKFLDDKQYDELLTELFDLEKSNPGNREVGELAREFRAEIIKRKIKEKSDLIYSDKFEDIHNFIDGLKRIDKNNKRVLDLEKMVKSAQHGSQVEEKGEFIYEGENHLKTLMRLKKYDKAVKVAEELLNLDKSNENVAKIYDKAKKKYFKQNRNKVVDIISENQKSLKEDYKKNKKDYIKL